MLNIIRFIIELIFLMVVYRAILYCSSARIFPVYILRYDPNDRGMGFGLTLFRGLLILLLG